MLCECSHLVLLHSVTLGKQSKPLTWKPTYTLARLIVGDHHKVKRRFGIWLRPLRCAFVSFLYRIDSLFATSTWTCRTDEPLDNTIARKPAHVYASAPAQKSLCVLQPHSPESTHAHLRNNGLQVSNTKVIQIHGQSTCCYRH